MRVGLLAHAQGYTNVNVSSFSDEAWNHKELYQQPPFLYSTQHTTHTHTTSCSGLKQQREGKNKEL